MRSPGDPRPIANLLALGLLATIMAPCSLQAADNPRIAMLWSPAKTEGPRADRMARYDLVLTSPDELGLEWRPNKHQALAEEFLPESIEPARERLNLMQEAHPGQVVVLELYFFEANENDYPADSPWWYRNKKGQKVQFWKGCYNMDVSNPDYRQHILKRVDAIQSATHGQAGLFFDNLRYKPAEKAAWVALLSVIRERYSDISILVNSGWESEDLEWVAPLVNGIMYEDSIDHTSSGDTEAYYARIHRQSGLCRQPLIGVNEIFGNRTDRDEMVRELVRTLVYTDLHYLFADSTYGHKHDWRPEWDAPLGKALQPAQTPAPGTLVKRDFEGGTVAWLPASAKSSVEIECQTPVTRLGSPGQPITRLSLQPGEGAILLKQVPAR